MAEVFAGFVCGFGLALVVTPVMAVALVRARVSSPFVQRAVPVGTPIVAVMMLLHTFAFLVLTALGIVLGLTLGGIEDRQPEGGLGSPNLVFTALILGMSGIAVGPLAIALPRLRLPLLAGGIVFAGVFGWLMPYLSLWGPEGS